jgi:hypothetical protein
MVHCCHGNYYVCIWVAYLQSVLFKLQFDIQFDVFVTNVSGTNYFLFHLLEKQHFSKNKSMRQRLIVKKIAKSNRGNLRFLFSKIVERNAIKLHRDGIAPKWEVKINWKMTLTFQDTVPMGRLTVVEVVSREIPQTICITIWKKLIFIRPM